MKLSALQFGLQDSKISAWPVNIGQSNQIDESNRIDESIEMNWKWPTEQRSRLIKCMVDLKCITDRMIENESVVKDNWKSIWNVADVIIYAAHCSNYVHTRRMQYQFRPIASRSSINDAYVHQIKQLYVQPCLRSFYLGQLFAASIMLQIHHIERGFVWFLVGGGGFPRWPFLSVATLTGRWHCKTASSTSLMRCVYHLPGTWTLTKYSGRIEKSTWRQIRSQRGISW